MPVVESQLIAGGVLLIFNGMTSEKISQLLLIFYILTNVA